MEKLSLDKFLDKELSSLKLIQGGQMQNQHTTWRDLDSEGNPTGTRGGDSYNSSTDEVSMYYTIVF